MISSDESFELFAFSWGGVALSELIGAAELTRMVDAAARL
jgi:hypothetical protein